MVCERCERKQAALITPNVKLGAERKVGVNKLLDKAAREKVQSKGSKCKVCRSPLQGKGKYCVTCAHKQGRCWMCGRKMVDVSKHNMSLA